MNACELYVQSSDQSLIPCAREGTEILKFGDGSKHHLCPEHYKTIMENVNSKALEESGD